MENIKKLLIISLMITTNQTLPIFNPSQTGIYGLSAIGFITAIFNDQQIDKTEEMYHPSIVSRAVPYVFASAAIEAGRIDNPQAGVVFGLLSLAATRARSLEFNQKKSTISNLLAQYESYQLLKATEQELPEKEKMKLFEELTNFTKNSRAPIKLKKDIHNTLCGIPLSASQYAYQEPTTSPQIPLSNASAVVPVAEVALVVR